MHRQAFLCSHDGGHLSLFFVVLLARILSLLAQAWRIDTLHGLPRAYGICHSAVAQDGFFDLSIDDRTFVSLS
jgi:hypothetical protein